MGLLGHKSVSMSARYVELSGPDLDEARHATTSHMSAMMQGDGAKVERPNFRAMSRPMLKSAR